MSKEYKTSQCTLIPYKGRIAFLSFANANFKQLPTRSTRKNLTIKSGRFHWKNRHYRGHSSQETKIYSTVPGTLAQPSQVHESSKTKIGDPFGRIWSFTAQYIVVDKTVRTVGSNSRRYKICFTRRSDKLATYSHSTVSGAIRKDLRTAIATDGINLVYKYNPQHACCFGSTYAEDEQD